MKYLEPDLDRVKTCLKANFVEPFTNNELTKFLIGESKFIRSKLAILYFKAQNLDFDAQIYNILAVGEIIHNSSLLHDDVLDNADSRRGNPTLSKLFGNKISILAGDYLLVYAIEKLLSLQNSNIIEVFKNCTKKMCESEIQQFLKRGIVPSEDEYLQFCSGKTAELYSAIFESIALVSKLDVVKAREFGKIFGLCFQIKNDLEINSSIQDKKNNVYTAINVLGIEKTAYLLDNYKEKMREMLAEFSDNIYKKGLEVLINDL